jgi:hypothetical protein
MELRVNIINRILADEMDRLSRPELTEEEIEEDPTRLIPRWDHSMHSGGAIVSMTPEYRDWWAQWNGFDSSRYKNKWLEDHKMSVSLE